MDRDKFEKYINKAILTIPKPLRDKIENLAFVIEEEPRPKELKERGIFIRGTLLGLYQGVPLTRRGMNYGSVLPDKITIFKKPVERLGNNSEENVVKIIKEVVYHEIGHYFGLSEIEVRNWERKKREKF